ncbi:hypothetical protein DH2020_049765 [Rehmannia glutinosa]|uniref:Uncharacterized protein n=1 Tax=Rehmannia glutinosa TaxID=99300 RepID=A0ABR0U2K4_REHGL
MGTAFLLALLGGFLSDAFFTTYVIYLISAVIEFLGLVILTVQAHSSSLKPPKCDPASLIPCQKVHGAKAAMLFLGLYLVALGVGGIKGSLPSHGAEQFDGSTPQGRKTKIDVFQLLCIFALVWRPDRGYFSGVDRRQQGVGMGVLIASMLNTCMPRSTSNAIASMSPSPSPTPLSDEQVTKQNNKAITESPSPQSPSQSLKFLNRAVVNKPACRILKCSVQQLEDVKIVLKILPIFGCTIMLNCCLAQLSTFSVQQAATMDTKLGSLKVPPASLPVFPVVFIMILAPIYDHVIIPFARRVTKSETGVTHLQRIGIGLVLSIIAMAVAALVEIKRKKVATDSNLLDSDKPLPITFFWIAFQYLFLGSADLFTLAGLLEFFFTEAPFSMRSLATALSWASLAMGYYLSTVIVSIVNSVTGDSKHQAWLSGENLNDYHLERFYWLMCVLSGLNFMHYLFWARKYKYRSIGSK